MDWSRFDQYKGTWAIDFDQLIADLLSTSADIRENARETIAQWPYEIVDQIGRLGAIPYVMECLLELISSETTPERDKSLYLVTQLVERSEEYAAFTQWYAGSPIDLVESITNVFQKKVSTYLTLLACPQSNVRASAAKALGLVRTDVSQALVAQLVDERDVDVIAAILASLGSHKNVRFLPDVLRLLWSDDVIIKGQAAGAVCQLAGEAYYAGLGILADQVVLGTDVDRARDEEREMLELNASNFAIRKLRECGHLALGWATDFWLARAPSVGNNNIVPYFTRVLIAVMPLDKPSMVRSIRPYQKTLLHAIVACDSFWSVDRFQDCRQFVGDAAGDAEYFRRQGLQDVGIPAGRSQLKEFLQGTT